MIYFYRLDNMEVLVTFFIAMMRFENVLSTKAIWYHERAVVRGQAELPCHVPDPIQESDKAILVLWYKEDLPLEPVYSYDTRNGPFHKGVRWADSSYLGSRAFFRINSDPPTLVVEEVKVADDGVYTCRVDYKIWLSSYTKINLTVIVPPGPPLILNDKGQEMRGRIGPLPEGSRVHMRCRSIGGTPAPELTWWRDGHRIRNLFRSKDHPLEPQIIIVANRNIQGSVITCQALNNNITEPSTTSVVVNVLLRPLSIEIVGNFDSLSEGKSVELICRTVGSRPAAQITWLIEDKPVMEVTRTIMNGGNVTTGTIELMPKRSDHLKTVTCRASNPDIADSIIETSRILIVLYKPQVNLSLGRQLTADNIKAGDDVYFECFIEANPITTRVTWHHDGKLLTTNKKKGLIVSTTSLVLQNLDRARAGNYSCSAQNAEGRGISSPVPLKIMYAPICASSMRRTQGVIRTETVKVTCQVEAFPPEVKFTWKFNASADGEPLPRKSIYSHGTTSYLNYTVNLEKDFGTLMCWASNRIGIQEEPCVINIIPEGEFENIPDPVRNCSITNQTSKALVVECTPGFDGGLDQTFHMDAWDQNTLLSNMSSSRPEFVIRGLDPGMGVTIKIHSSNILGRSILVILEADIMKVAEKRMGPPEEITVPPVIGAVVGGVAAFLVLILTGLLFTRYAHRSSRGVTFQTKEKSPSIQFTEIYDKPSIGEEMVNDIEGSPDLVCSTTKSGQFTEVPHSAIPLTTSSGVDNYTSYRHSNCSSPRFMDTLAVLQEMSSGVATVPDNSRSGLQFQDISRCGTHLQYLHQEPSIIGSQHIHYQPPPPFNDALPPISRRSFMRQQASNFPPQPIRHNAEPPISDWQNLQQSSSSSCSLRDLSSSMKYEVSTKPSSTLACYGTLDRRKLSKESLSMRVHDAPSSSSNHQESSV